jgi:hypothetical protein
MDADLKQYLEAMEGRRNEHFNTTLKGLEDSIKGRGNGLEGLGNRLADRVSGLEGRLVETMRDVQNELLRVFAEASEDETIRLRKM